MLCFSSFELRVNVTQVHIGDRGNTRHVPRTRQISTRRASLLTSNSFWKRRASVTRIAFRIGSTDGLWPYPPEALDWLQSPCRRAAIPTTRITVLRVVCHRDAFSVCNRREIFRQGHGGGFLCHEGLGVEGVVPEARDHPTSGRSPYSRVHRSAKTPKASRAVTLYALPCGQS